MKPQNHYTKVAAAEEIAPNGMLRVYAHGAWILVVKLDDEYFAIADTCTHEEASLYKGVFKDGCVRCPLHGSRFDIKTGIPLDEPAYEPVAVYPVKVMGGSILVGPSH